MKKRKKVVFTVLIILVAVILILICALSVVARKNMAAMNRCIDAAMEELKQNYTVRALNPGEYKELKIFRVLKFHVDQYDVEGLGNLSVMRVNMGAMQMDTLLITPKNKNLPILSADYMYAFNNRKAYLEFYDVVKEKDEQYMKLMDELSAVQANYQHLENFEVAEAWYDQLLTVASFKSGKAAEDSDFINLFVDSLRVYLEHSKNIPQLSEEERREKLEITRAYTNDLIDKGGVSTNIFKKQLGIEETRKFFDNVFFGTAAQ